MTERIVKVQGFDGKEYEVKLREISWDEAQTILGQSLEFKATEQRINMEKLRKLLVKYSIKEVSGFGRKVDPYEIMKMIPAKEGNKIFKAVLELNPLELILEV